VDRSVVLLKRLDAMLRKQAAALENKTEVRCEDVECSQQDGPGSRSPSPVRKQTDTGADETNISKESTDQADTDDTLVYDKSGDQTVLVKDASELEGVKGKEDEVMGEIEMDNLTGVIETFASTYVNTQACTEETLLVYQEDDDQGATDVTVINKDAGNEGEQMNLLSSRSLETRRA
jgi:hypothetical protein